MSVLALAAVAVMAAGTVGPAAAQPADTAPAASHDPQPPRPGDTVWVTPGQRYRAGRLQRWLLGSGHRDLWTLPVPAPVLDLDDFAGGLTPTVQGGGRQTPSLRFSGADGRTWIFRSLDKDASRTLDPVLRESLAAWAVQDRFSAILPLGALVVSPLLEAAGVLHTPPRLVIMSDVPALGEHREAFAGVLGWIEERADEGADAASSFAAAARVVGSDRLLERLLEGPESAVDAPAFLRARLLDFLVGDWDRHPDQWRWAGFTREDRLVFEPVPRDRDWAFSRLDGLMSRVTSVPWPHYVGFGPEYPSVFRLSWSGRALDRRILPLLDRAAFEEVGRDVAARLTDDVIADAVRRLPPSYLDAVGAELESALRRRRDDLPAMALAYHAHLARWVDLHGTGRPEIARVRRLGGGRLEVTVAAADRPGEPHLARVFDATETREVRLYLHGGEDRAVVEGEDEDAPRVRVVGGAGRDVLEDHTAGSGVSLHDEDAGDRLVPGTRTAVSRASWTEPFDPATTSHQAPARDWGSRWTPLGRVEVGPDVGVLVGAGARRTTYGFRRWPFASRLDVWAGVASATGEPVVSVDFETPLTRRLVATLEAEAGGRLRRFHGWGNDTPGEDPSGRWEVVRRGVSVEAGGAYRIGSALAASAGVGFRVLGEERGRGSLVGDLDPYGSGTFRQVGLRAGLELDPSAGSPDREGDPPPVRVSVEGRWFPPLLDVTGPYGGLGMAATAAHGWEGRLRPRLSVRARGERMWGALPWHDAVTLGGSTGLRGERSGRWTGDAALSAGAEMQVFLTDALLLLPAEIGVLALADVGRVYVDGASPGGWHHALGAGVWVSFLDTWTLRAAAVRGERVRLILGVGLPGGVAP